MSDAIDERVLEAIRQFDGTAIANAIETFDVRLRNEGFSDGRVRCFFHDLPPVAGYAVTARIRSSSPPPIGHSYYDRTDWWTYIRTIPFPRIVVVEDLDERPGLGAFIGQIHASILQALGCVAYATNGSVRDLPAVQKTGFQFFANSVSVSHAFVHLIDFAQPVTVGGLRVQSGDLIYGDCHGVLTIPPSIATEVPVVAARMRTHEQRIVDFCRSRDFSLEGLRTLIEALE